MSAVPDATISCRFCSVVASDDMSTDEQLNNVSSDLDAHVSGSTSHLDGRLWLVKS